MFNKSYRYEPRVSSTRHERLKPAPVHSVEMLEKKIMTIGSLLTQVTERHGDTFAVSAKVFAEALKNGNTIFWCGNGGRPKALTSQSNS